MLIENVEKTRQTAVGKFLDSITERTSGGSSLVALNFICTATLGFIMTYPLYLVGGIWAALPTGIFTLFILSIFGLCIFNSISGGALNGPVLRKLLSFGILFSLPFGLLSLPMLYKVSSLASGKQKNES